MHCRWRVRWLAAFFSNGCKSHPATIAPAGSNRNSLGGNEVAEASGVEGHIWWVSTSAVGQQRKSSLASECPLSGAKQTSISGRSMSAYSHKRTQCRLPTPATKCQKSARPVRWAGRGNGATASRTEAPPRKRRPLPPEAYHHRAPPRLY